MHLCDPHISPVVVKSDMLDMPQVMSSEGRLLPALTDDTISTKSLRFCHCSCSRDSGSSQHLIEAGGQLPAPAVVRLPAMIGSSTRMRRCV